MKNHETNESGVILGYRCPECKTAVVFKQKKGPGGHIRCVCCNWIGTEPEHELPGDPDPNMIKERRCPEDTYRVTVDYPGTTVLYYIPGTYIDDSAMEAGDRAIVDAYSYVSGTIRSADIHFKNKRGQWVHTVTMNGSGA